MLQPLLIPLWGDAFKRWSGETAGMSYRYNPFSAAYPSSRGPIEKILRPAVDHRTYLRALPHISQISRVCAS